MTYLANALILAESILILSADEPQEGDRGNMGLTLNFTQAVFPLSYSQCWSSFLKILATHESPP